MDERSSNLVSKEVIILLNMQSLFIAKNMRAELVKIDLVISFYLSVHSGFCFFNPKFENGRVLVFTKHRIYTIFEIGFLLWWQTLGCKIMEVPDFFFLIRLRCLLIE